MDGFIARDSQDNLSWGSKEDKNFFRNKTKEIGTMIMGSTTFDSMPPQAFSGRNSMVFTSNPAKYSDFKINSGNIDFFNGTPIAALESLEKKGVKEAVLIGGGNLIRQFLKENLINEIYVTIAPYLFGKGIQGFGFDGIEKDLELINFENITKNEILLHYKVLNINK